MRKPASAKSWGWFGQVGSLIQIVAEAPAWRRKSAATRRPPVPPGVWLTATRPLDASSAPSPKT